MLALDGDAGLPAGCCPPATRDVEVYAELDLRSLEVPAGDHVEAVIHVRAQPSETRPVSIRALTHSDWVTVDVPVPAGCSPYVVPDVVVMPGQ